MKKGFLIIISSLMAMTIQAQTISEQKAQQIAAEFFAKTQSTQKRQRTPSSLSPQQTLPSLAYQSTDNNGNTALYIYNNVEDGGFVIVAGDEQATSPILGWSDNGPFDYENAPCGLKALLEQYAEGIPFLAPRNGESEAMVGPFITSHWNQEEPYNSHLGGGKYNYTGCVATAVAQVMNYWQWPKHGWGRHTSTSWADQSVDFTQSVYDWDNMLDNYVEGAYTEEQALAVGKLMYDIGCATDMVYNTPTGSSTDHWRALNALFRYFDYNEDIHLFGNYLDMGGERWPSPEYAVEYLKQELDNGRPFIIHVVAVNVGASHSVVCDGYNTDGYFHFNYGWGGEADGYYAMYADPEVIVGIRPPKQGREMIDGVEYSITDEGKAMVCGTDASGKVSIPAEIQLSDNTYPVEKFWRFPYHYQQGITEVKLPGSIKEIVPKAFAGCPKLTDVWLSEGVEHIGIQAFAGCKRQYLFLPSTILKIDGGAFGHCETVFTHAVGYTIGGAAFICDTFDGIEGASRIDEYGVSGLTGAFTVQPTCQYGKNAVTGHMDEIIIPNNVTQFDKQSVWGTKAYSVADDHPTYSQVDGILYSKDRQTLVVYPSDLNTWVTIPNGTKKIEPGAFERVTINYLTLPTSLEDINGSFASNRDLRQVTCLSSTPITISDPTTFNNVIHNYGLSVLRVPVGSKMAYEQAVLWKDFNNIREEVLTVSPFLYEVELSQGYARLIGRDTNASFDGHVRIPEQVELNGSAYPVCAIADDAVRGDKELKTITLPKTFDYSINSGYPFTGCNSLYAWTVKEGNKRFNSMEGMLIEEFHDIYWDLRYLVCCPPMQEVNSNIVPRTTVTVPDVQKIRPYAFGNTLHRVIIPESVTEIQPCAFVLCPDLKDVICLASTPPTAHDIFDENNHAFHSGVFLPEHGTTLYVPTGCKDTYAKAKEWQLFPNIVEIDPTNITYEVQELQEFRSSDNTLRTYNLQGQRVSNSYRGIVIKGKVKMKP